MPPLFRHIVATNKGYRAIVDILSIWQCGGSQQFFDNFAT